MKNRIFQLLLALLALALPYSACTPPPEENPGGGTISANEATGTWDPGAGYNASYSFRNHRYTFEIKNNGGSVEINLESSEVDVSLQLFNRLFQSIGHAFGDRSETIALTDLDAGKYTIIVGSYERGDLSQSADYQLKIKGNDTPLQRVASASLEATGAWLTGGGGYNNPASFRNHRYQFEVTESDENSALDIMLVATGAKGSIQLFDPNGASIGHAFGNTEESLYIYIDEPGTYTVVVGTYQRDQIGATYRVDVCGQIANLRQVPASESCGSGTLVVGGGYNQPQSPYNEVYTFEVTEDNSHIDVVLKANFEASLWVYNPQNDLIGHNFGNSQEEVLRVINKGTYRVICGKYQSADAGNYEMCVVGQIANFKKE
jgi:hypothetical protein